jgi:hypothetical protein
MDEPQQFASFDWQKRWNNNNPDTTVASLSQSGDRFGLVSCLGFVRFDNEDSPHLIAQLESALKLLKEHFAASNAEIAARELIRQGRKIAAIKEYRRLMYELNGELIGLKEAKEFVEGLL